MKTDKSLRVETSRALGNLLTFTAQLFNIGKNLNDGQIGLLVQDLLECYWHWRFDEFIYVLKEAGRGTWGTNYDRLDAPTVHGWCQKYETQRSELIEHEALTKHKKNRLGEAGRGELLPAEQMPQFYFRALLESKTDDVLTAGIAHYEKLGAYLRAKQPEDWEAAALVADFKVKTAQDILSDRAAWAKHNATRPKTAAEDDEVMIQVKREWLLSRQREREETEMKETGAYAVE